MKIILSRTQWDDIGNKDGRTKFPPNKNRADIKNVDRTRLLDFYKKEDSDLFIEPCNTCIHRHKNVNDKDCPCKGCTRYY
jgi:hypothetical protein